MAMAGAREGGDKKAERIVNAFWQQHSPEIMTRADCSFISGVSCFADDVFARHCVCQDISKVNRESRAQTRNERWLAACTKEHREKERKKVHAQNPPHREIEKYVEKKNGFCRTRSQLFNEREFILYDTSFLFCPPNDEIRTP